MRHAAERNTYYRFLVLFLTLLIGLAGCAPTLFKSSSDPLREFTLEGKGDEKVLLIPLRGTVSTKPDEGIFRTKPSMVQEVVSHLRKAQKDPSIKAVLLEIESPGGSVTAGLAIYDTIQFLKCDVATYCVGQAASMGAVLLAAGAAGKRFALPNARIMIHQPWGGVEGVAADISIQAKEILRLRDRINEILSEHTGKSVDQVGRDTDRDYFMSASEAKSYGLVDEVVKSRKVSGRKGKG